MANHPYRGGPVLVVYTRDASGQLQRHSIRGMHKEQHMEHYNIGPTTETERLIGWPERSVEWHGNTGYATPKN